MGDLDHRDSDDDFLNAENLARLGDTPHIQQSSGAPDLNTQHSAGAPDLNIHKDNVKKSGLLTDEKLRSIMSFLDEVEMADRLSEIENAQVRIENAQVRIENVNLLEMHT